MRRGILPYCLTQQAHNVEIMLIHRIPTLNQRCFNVVVLPGKKFTIFFFLSFPLNRSFPNLMMIFKQPNELQSVDPDHTCVMWHLIWFYTVCSDFSVRILVKYDRDMLVWSFTLSNQCLRCPLTPASILYKSIAGRYRPVSYSDALPIIDLCSMPTRVRRPENVLLVRLPGCTG